MTTIDIPAHGPEKPRIDLIPPAALWRVGLHLAAHASDNDPLELYGLPRGDDTTIMDCVASLKRHVEQFLMGENGEDHPAAIAANALFICEIHERVRLGLLPMAFDDRPTWYAGDESPEAEPVDDGGPMVWGHCDNPRCKCNGGDEVPPDKADGPCGPSAS